MTPMEKEIFDRKNKTRLQSQIEHWLDTVDYREFYSDIAAKVIGQPELNMVTANVYKYLKNVVDVNYKRTTCEDNMILAAPSGSGKTETFRALKEYFAMNIPLLPVIKHDVSQITSTGFKGEDASDILTPFYELGFLNAIGLVFLDEFDKKLKPSYASGGMDVNEEAQNNLLTIIEGSVVYNKKEQAVDTTNLMFIGLGSFDAFRKKRANEPRKMGFMADGEEPVAVEVDHYAPITKENIVEHGGTNELVGRFKYVVNYNKLSDEAIDKIIQEAAKKSCISFDCDVIITDAFQKELRKEANSKFGCRGIASIIDSLVLKEYSASLLDEPNDKNEVLLITLEGKDASSHTWRAYNEEEISEMASWMDVDYPEMGDGCPNLSDDQWEALDKIQDKYDPFI